MSYEYKVIPAPARGLKAKGLKTHQDRFAHALETVINEQAGDGWDYVRADTLPCEQREGLLSKTTVYQNMLVFRRARKLASRSPKTPVTKVPHPKPPAPKPAAAPVPLKAVETPPSASVEKLKPRPKDD